MIIEKEVCINEVKELLKQGKKVEVSSPDGWVEVNEYVEKGFKKEFIVIADEKEVHCSNDHMFLTESGWKFAKDIDLSDKILCENTGFKKVEKIENTGKQIKVVDLSVNHLNHRYYTNGLTSHNTNKGKSLIMCSLACDSLLNNRKVLYITLEMEKRMIGERILANLFDVDMDNLVLLSREKFKDKYEKIRIHIKQNLIVQEYPTKTMNANHIRTLVKELEVKKNFKPDIIFLDYMGLMVPINSSKSDNSYAEQKRISEEVRGVSAEIGPPIVSGIQTNRDGAESTDVDMTDIADSFGSAMTADLIIAGTQSDEMREAGKYVWTIVKNRYGRNKIRFRVNVDFPKMRVTSDDEEMEKMNKHETPKASKIVDEASVIALKTLSSSRATARADKKITFK